MLAVLMASHWRIDQIGSVSLNERPSKQLISGLSDKFQIAFDMTQKK